MKMFLLALSFFSISSAHALVKFNLPALAAEEKEASEVWRSFVQCNRRTPTLKVCSQKFLDPQLDSQAVNRFQMLLMFNYRVGPASQCSKDDESHLKELRSLPHEGMLCSVALSPDGRRALSGGFDRTMRLWDVEVGKQLGSFPGHSELVYHVAFSPDGRRALSSSFDKTIRLWRLPK